MKAAEPSPEEWLLIYSAAMSRAEAGGCGGILSFNVLRNKGIFTEH